MRLEATVLKKLTIAAGFGAGYVLGAKAGKERYAQIEAKAREIAGMPAVQSATTTVKETATGVAGSAKQAINDRAEASSNSSEDVDVLVDFGPGPAPMTGAAASGSAPDTVRK
jgi:hypothetical protein